MIDSKTLDFFIQFHYNKRKVNKVKVNNRQWLLFDLVVGAPNRTTKGDRK